MSESRNNVEEALRGVPLSCPKCGSVEFFVLATAIVSASVNIFRSEEGEIVVEQGDWDGAEIVEDGEEYPLTCTECGHTPDDRDLVADN